jgi:hypothetical protein
VAVLGRTATGAGGTIAGHAAPAMRVDAGGVHAVSSDYLSNVLVWDLRQTLAALAAPARVGTVSWEGQYATTVAVAPDGSSAAIAVAGGLHLLRMATCHVTPVAPPAAPAADPTYIDVRWHAASRRLLAANATGTVDCYDADSL